MGSSFFICKNDFIQLPLFCKLYVMANEKRTRLEVAGDTMLDLGKLTFAGLVLAGIFDANINKMVLITIGLIFCFALILTGIYLITKK